MFACSVPAPALRELAGYPLNDCRGARDFWIQARKELGKPFEDYGVARRTLVRSWPSEVVGGTLAPRTGMSLVFGEGWLVLGQPPELDYLVALVDDWDDMPQKRDVVGTQIMDAARRALDVWQGPSAIVHSFLCRPLVDGILTHASR